MNHLRSFNEALIKDLNDDNRLIKDIFNIVLDDERFEDDRAESFLNTRILRV